MRAGLVALAAGAFAALALPPFHFLPALLAFTLLVHLLRRARSAGAAFRLGWCFGFGHFALGLYWIVIAFFTDAERFGLLAVPAVALLCAVLALFPAFACGLTAGRRWRSAAGTALALAMAWAAGELARGVVFHGFPWNLIGYSWVGFAPAQLSAWIGVHGLGLLTVALAGLLATFLEPGDPYRRTAPLTAALALALIWAGGAARLAGAEPATVPEVRLRLVQGNVDQHHKWQAELRARWFERHLDLSAAAGAPSHIIWPESATPFPLEHDATARQMIAQVVPPGGIVITGSERFALDADPSRAWNSLFVLDGSGTILAHYDKRLLVPFGEFLPLRDVLGRLGLKKLTRGSIDFHPGPGPVTLTIDGLPPFSPLICYEVIFSGQLVPPDARPAWLLNLTNDAWFGNSSGPYQHLAMARMRTIEEGLPLVRSANTGISAIVDPWGRVVARLGLGETGVLDSGLPAALAPTLFARWRLLPLLLLVLTALALAIVIERRHRPRAGV